MPDETPWPAPAKINLFLHVLGRRADGYHELQTVFQFLDFSDQVHVRARDDGAIRRVTALEDVSEAEDLSVRAAEALRRASGARLGADIQVRKSIPLGTGLGGGSSDAATVLVALNELWGLRCPVDTLAEIGLGLGADVPVFVRGSAAWAEGRGERLTPVRLQPSWYVLVLPRCEVSTASVFGAPALTRNTPALKISDCLERWSAESLEIGLDSLMRHTRNDCQELVRARYPLVAAALDWLDQFGEARMTGTGAAVFVPVESREQGERCAAVAPQGWRVRVARGLSRSPLVERLEQCAN